MKTDLVSLSGELISLDERPPRGGARGPACKGARKCAAAAAHVALHARALASVLQRPLSYRA